MVLKGVSLNDLALERVAAYMPAADSRTEPSPEDRI
jgi:hypothetical protein